jgi:hypothetical protein
MEERPDQRPEEHESGGHDSTSTDDNGARGEKRLTVSELDKHFGLDISVVAKDVNCVPPPGGEVIVYPAEAEWSPRPLSDEDAARLIDLLHQLSNRDRNGPAGNGNGAEAHQAAGTEGATTAVPQD